jgi:hypothetical protein
MLLQHFKQRKGDPSTALAFSDTDGTQIGGGDSHYSARVREACKLGCEGIVSKQLGSPYRSGRSAHWVKVKNPKAPAVKREAEEDWST